MITTIDLTKVTAKKHSVRFDTDDADAPLTNVYIAQWWVLNNGGALNGVRVTIEPLDEGAE